MFITIHWLILVRFLVSFSHQAWTSEELCEVIEESGKEILVHKG